MKLNHGLVYFLSILRIAEYQLKMEVAQPMLTDFEKIRMYRLQI